MAGEHNALNATAAAALAAGQGVPTEAIIEAVATFKSVKRRLEVRAVVDGVTIIDDFAHHPTAIRETLRALRESYPGRRMWAVLEPRSNTLRRNVFELDLVESLALADRVVLASVFKSESIPAAERLHPEHVVAALDMRGTPAALFADADAIVAAIVPQLGAGDVVAILSNGGFGDIYRKLPAAISCAQLAATQSALICGGDPVWGMLQTGMFATFKLAFVYLALGPIAGIVGIPYTLLVGDISLLYRVAMWITNAGVRAAGIKIEMTGLENIPAGRSCIFMSNHVSNLDPPVVLPLLPGRSSVLLKKELMNIPILGKAMRMAKFVPVERGTDAMLPRPVLRPPPMLFVPDCIFWCIPRVPVRATEDFRRSRRGRSFLHRRPRRRSSRSLSPARRP